MNNIFFIYDYDTAQSITKHGQHRLKLIENLLLRETRKKKIKEILRED